MSFCSKHSTINCFRCGAGSSCTRLIAIIGVLGMFTFACASPQKESAFTTGMQSIVESRHAHQQKEYNPTCFEAGGYTCCENAYDRSVTCKR